MKSVPLALPNSRGVLASLVRSAPPTGVNLGEMSARLKLLDKIEAEAGDVLVLEDNEHAQLVHVIQTTQFSVVDKNVAAVCTAAIEAGAAAAAKQVKNKAA